MWDRVSESRGRPDPPNAHASAQGNCTVRTVRSTPHRMTARDHRFLKDFASDCVLAIFSVHPYGRRISACSSDLSWTALPPLSDFEVGVTKTLENIGCGERKQCVFFERQHHFWESDSSPGFTPFRRTLDRDPPQQTTTYLWPLMFCRASRHNNKPQLQRY